MIATVHIIVGGAIGVGVGVATHNPALALVAGAASHLVLDAIPHMDHPPASRDKNDELIWTPAVWAFAFVDSGIAMLILLAMWLFVPSAETYYFLIGGIGAYLPDFIDNVLFWKNFVRRLPGFKQFHGFHEWLHDIWEKRFPMPKYWVLGVGTQLVVMALSLWYLL